ncbi:hypothetical protein Sste5346_005109 [Sporothrix stenoceras]|uniref:Short chain dehydrogenase reductase n=1 Tax=Sporothrix stenoceras TaxID=5173 RepID=A0ABR3Z7Y2_9PEZI
MASMTATVAAAIGRLPRAVTCLAVLYAGIKIARALYKMASFIGVYARPSQLHRYIYKDADGRPPWALVTGASDGVGVAFADQLAAAGLNVMLHGRNETKLEGVRQQLSQKHPQTQFRLFVADATQVCHPRSPGSTDFAIDDLVEKHLGDLHLTVLINNAGGGLMAPTYGSLAETSSARIVQNVMLNGVFPLVLTARVLELFQRRSQLQSTPVTPALVMNIGSLADLGMPFVTPYAASKTLMLAATSIARRELEALGHGDTIQMLAVRFGVVTGVSHTKTTPKLLEPDTQTMARAALARTGSGRDIVIGHLPQAFQNLTMGPLPARMLDRIFEKIMMERRTKEKEEMSQQKKAK